MLHLAIALIVSNDTWLPKGSRTNGAGSAPVCLGTKFGKRVIRVAICHVYAPGKRFELGLEPIELRGLPFILSTKT